ncbi:hypothetical protein A2U01_0106804, partial [Trifolium medium]|nr:hypothetical protein [Trifolium medium]
CSGGQRSSKPVGDAMAGEAAAMRWATTRRVTTGDALVGKTTCDT